MNDAPTSPMPYTATLKPFIQNVHALHMQVGIEYRRQIFSILIQSRKILGSDTGQKIG
jgi:hypothetical protein